ncbi:hypothetical protein AMV075 [Betaentomopoxvirus amoorei]|uniref:AMV075 n=1 Tax=Amsacta moorei entomopoxvirus TaxID=28321 RepID=Q9EMX4_AMEPV|nr:hypothetical protein AMV075 [Amsacta moorei entomopoxvirus]AAG02781.1 AMV075 [Amsacta moorei entomopoxvirus]
MDLINILINKKFIPDLCSLINIEGIMEILIDKNIIIIDDINNPSLSELKISIKTIYDIFESMFGKTIIKKIIFEGLLKNVLNETIDPKDELLMYTGYCKDCDSDAEIFNLDMNDYENSLSYANNLVMNFKYKNSYTYLDLFCDKCGKTLYDKDPYEIY